MTETGTKSATGRLISLDALRGFTIAAMVIVNNPGSWEQAYWPLKHAKWNGCTPTDLIFPFFLFIVGVSITLAYSKRLEANVSKGKIYRKIISRSIIIYLLGVFLWLWPEFDFGAIRWTGVLQRISLVFLVCALLFLNSSWKTQMKIGAVILLLYWIIVAYLPVPGVGRPDLLGPGKNWTNYLDSLFLPGVMYRGTWDPESILSTFPAIVTGITGMLAGKLYLTVKDEYKRLTWLFLMGFTMFIAGSIWNWLFPINKNLWTSSFVLYTSGLATMALSACILLVDIRGFTRWSYLGRVYGANAIASYVLAEMLPALFHWNIIGGRSINSLFMDSLISLNIEPKMVSFIYAVLYMLIIYIPALVLYRKKIFIKV